MNVAKQTEKLKADVVGAINSSPLPIVLKRYVVADIFRGLDIEYLKQLSVKESKTTDEQNIQ